MSNPQNKFLIVLVGPTAVGKTAHCIALAKHFGTEIVSSDSRQVYREMRIGTAVPSVDELNSVQHHLIQHRSIFAPYNANMFEQEALDVIKEIHQKHKIVLATGGSGLYVNTLCHGIDELPDTDPVLRKELREDFEKNGIESLRRKLKKLDPVHYKRVDLKNHQRILKALEVTLSTGKPYSSFLTRSKAERPFRIIKLGLNMDRSLLHQRIAKRVDLMMEAGLLEEVKELFPHRELNALNTVGYRELFDFLEDKILLEKAIELIKRNTRRYARKQISWFSRDTDMPWFAPEDIEGTTTFIEKHLD